MEKKQKNRYIYREREMEMALVSKVFSAIIFSTVKIYFGSDLQRVNLGTFYQL